MYEYNREGSNWIPTLDKPIMDVPCKLKLNEKKSIDGDTIRYNFTANG